MTLTFAVFQADHLHVFNEKFLFEPVLLVGRGTSPSRLTQEHHIIEEEDVPLSFFPIFLVYRQRSV